MKRSLIPPMMCARADGTFEGTVGGLDSPLDSAKCFETRSRFVSAALRVAAGALHDFEQPKDALRPNSRTNRRTAAAR